VKYFNISTFSVISNNSKDWHEIAIIDQCLFDALLPCFTNA